MSLTIDTLLDQQHIIDHDSFVVEIVTKLYQNDISIDNYLHKQETLTVRNIPIKFQQQTDGVHIVSFNQQSIDLLFMY